MYLHQEEEDIVVEFKWVVTRCNLLRSAKKKGIGRIDP